MIKVLFFASIREQLGVDQLSLPLPSPTTTVAELIVALAKQNDSSWSTVLGASNVVTAINQQVVVITQCLSDGDEVAFFPPVTGG